ncbi:hypothetical protein [Paraburkholderia hospita]|uniref:hypothetical protein n=1 Tax=Paraburkholderia hospita TaxID=169430 RepID=UPI00115F816A|nr:hypothetical protein [Paraburkholderia hospita]
MENTLAGGQSSGAQSGAKIEMTLFGKVVLILLFVGAGVGGWFYSQGQGAGTHATNQVVRAAQASAHANTQPSLTSSGSAPDHAAQDLAKERHERAVQIAAWRAVSDVNRQQLADLNASMQTLDAKLDAIQKMSTVPRPSKDDAAESARAVHRAAEVAKVVAAIDVGSLPIETVTAQALNLAGFGKGIVGIGNQKLSVGQAWQQGETIVAIDPESRSIVTSRRIINVTN